MCGWQNSYSTENSRKSYCLKWLFCDVNYLCIFVWANGNEGGWNTAVDNPKLRPTTTAQRHVFHLAAGFHRLAEHVITLLVTDNMYRSQRGHKVFTTAEFLHGLDDRGQGAGLKELTVKV